ncbi:hypothetical protein N430_02285 [Pseudomonas sp. CC120222-01a]|nr:hypothetical protein N430_02285 [Pseudomonas sp. CC120222-01a]
MSTDNLFQGENLTHPLFCVEPGIPCQDAREQPRN